MAYDSRVSVAYGIELQGWALLHQCLAYAFCQSARTFFALVAGRTRLSALVLDTPLRSRHALAALPAEIYAMILDRLFELHLMDSRDKIVDHLGTCACRIQACLDDRSWLDKLPSFEYSRAGRSSVWERGVALAERETQNLLDPEDHVCGLDCRQWYYCCDEVVQSLQGSLPLDHNDSRYRKFKEGQQLRKWHSLIRGALSHFGLFLLSGSLAGLDERNIILTVGLPLLQAPSSDPADLCLSTLPPPSAADDEAQYPQGEPRRVVSLRPLKLTAEERQRFTRARILLNAAFFNEDWVVAGRDGRETPSVPSEEPAVLVMHENTSWLW